MLTTKFEALHSGAFLRLEFTGTVAITRNNVRWAQAFITYRPRPYELPITEDIQIRLPFSTRPSESK